MSYPVQKVHISKYLEGSALNADKLQGVADQIILKQGYRTRTKKHNQRFCYCVTNTQCGGPEKVALDWSTSNRNWQHTV